MTKPSHSHQDKLAEKAKQGTLIIVAIAVALAIIVSSTTGFSPSGDFVTLPGGGIYLPFIAAGLLIGLFTLFVNPKRSITLAVILQLVLPTAAFYGLAHYQEKQTGHAIKLQAIAEQKACQDAYTKNKDLFKVSNFTAEPVRDSVTNKVTAMKVGFDIVSGIEKLSSTKLTLRTEDGSIVLNANKAISEYMKLQINSFGSQRVVGTLPNISEKTTSLHSDQVKLLPVFYIGENIILSDENDSSYLHTENCSYNQNTGLYNLHYTDSLSFEASK